MMAFSRSQRRKYYYHTVRKQAVYETPPDAIADFRSVLFALVRCSRVSVSLCTYWYSVCPAIAASVLEYIVIT